MDKDIFYLTTISEKEAKKDEEKLNKLFEEVKPSFQKIMKKIFKENPHIRTMGADILLRAIIHDSKLPSYLVLGMLENIKNEVMTDNIIPKRKNEKKNLSYVN